MNDRYWQVYYTCTNIVCQANELYKLAVLNSTFCSMKQLPVYVQCIKPWPNGLASKRKLKTSINL